MKSKEYNNYLLGLNKALEVVTASGVDALRNEIRFRGKIGAPVNVSKGAFEEFQESVKRDAIQATLVMSSWVLHDKFGFGRKRLDKFVTEYNELSACLVGDFVDWGGIVGALAEECGIEIDEPWKEDEKNESD
jgi:hypothetical protein